MQSVEIDARSYIWTDQILSERKPTENSKTWAVEVMHEIVLACDTFEILLPIYFHSVLENGANVALGSKYQDRNPRSVPAIAASAAVVT